MATIVTRSGKGSPLTNTEVDANFTNLNTDKAELSGSTFTGNLSLGDNVKLQLGNQTNGDLQIYHDGSNSYIQEAGSGNLYIQGSNAIRLRSSASLENMLEALENGAVTLFHNNSPKIATTSTGIDVTGNIESDSVTIGVGSVATTEKLRVNGTVLTLGGSVSTPAIGVGDTNTGIYAPTSGTLGWTVNGNQRLLLNSTGIDVTGTVVADGLTVQDTSKAVEFAGFKSNGVGQSGSNANGEIVLGITSAYQGIITYNGIEGDMYIENTWDDASALTHITFDDKKVLTAQGNGDISFYNTAGTSQNLFWDSSTSRLGLGVTNPSAALDISQSNTRGAYLRSSTTGSRMHFLDATTASVTTVGVGAEGNNMVLIGGGSEILRLNSSGSSTFSGSVSAGTVAQVFTSSDRGYFVAGTSDSSNQHLYLGSYHGSTLKELVFSGSNASLYPKTTASIDLGLTTHKFKNLNLSGTISSGAITSTGLTVDGSLGQLALQGSGAEIHFSRNGNNDLLANGGSSAALTIGANNNVRFLTGGQERLRIESAGRVGIGTSSPDVKLHLSDSTSGSIIRLERNDTAIVAGDIYGGIEFEGQDGSTNASGVRGSITGVGTSGAGAMDILFSTAAGGTTTNSERMRIDSSGRVGIGTSSPLSPLHIQGTDDVAVRIKATGANSLSRLLLQNDARTWAIDNDGANGDALTFYDATAVAERMRIDSSGHVIVNNGGSGNGIVKINGATGNTEAVIFQRGGTEASRIGHANSADLTFSTGTGATERMRITSSGNLLVGKTALGVGVDGAQFIVGGYSGVSATNNPSFFVNRNSGDGSVLEVGKNGVSVGSIGYSSGNGLYMHTSFGNDSGLVFGSERIVPCTSTGTFDDAVVDLGYSSGRFKDLYLSSGVYLGGIGAANKLDDYEEGTWTPANAANLVINSVLNARYTKVGDIVTVTAWLKTNPSSTTFIISGLPFSSAGRSTASISDVTNAITISNQIVGVNIYGYGGSTTGTNNDFFISATYHV